MASTVRGLRTVRERSLRLVRDNWLIKRYSLNNFKVIGEIASADAEAPSVLTKEEQEIHRRERLSSTANIQF